MNMNRRVVVSVLVAVFVLAGLSSPASAQASTDAVLVMHFDEGSGAIAKDESGYGNDGTIYGATWTTGIFGKALQFDGVDDYIRTPTVSGYFDTIEFWVYFENVITKDSQTHCIMQFSSRRHQGISAGSLTGSATDETLTIMYPPGGGGTDYCTYIRDNIPAGWNHIVFAYDGSLANKYAIYVNGGSKATYRGSQTIGRISDDYIYIGKWNDNSIKGKIDEVGIYSKPLTPEEIKAHYNAKRAGGSTEESAYELINSVSTRIDVLKRNNVDTSLIEEALKNAQDAFDLGNYDEAYELAQSALKMADDAYEAQQHIESAQSEIEDAKSIGAVVKDAEAKLKEAKDALNKGNYEYAQEWADDASELAKRASIGSVQIKDLKALATKYDERTVVISGTIRDIETVYGEGYTFALDDGSGMISVVYQGSLGDIKDGDKVTASGIFQASTGTVVADTVQKSGVGGGGVPGFEAIFALTGLLAVAYLVRRRKVIK